MGYTTDFSGAFDVQPAMHPQIQEFLNKLCETRRMKRDTDNFGIEGEFFVNEYVSDAPKTLDSNRPSSTQPGLWCQWDAVDENTLEWDGGEKFYNYVEWLVYIIEKVLKPNGYKVNGEVIWSGEEAGDTGKIFVTDNVVETLEAFSDEKVLHTAGENVRTDITFKVKEDTVDISNVNFTEKDLNYWKENAQENYITTPISVLRYISELEKQLETK